MENPPTVPADPTTATTVLCSESQSEGVPPIKRRKTDVGEPSGAIDESGSENGADAGMAAALSESMDVPQALNFCNAIAELRSAVPLGNQSIVTTDLSDSGRHPAGDQPISTAGEEWQRCQ